MRVTGSLRGWLRLPSRIALLLGMGALSAAGVRPAGAAVPPQPSVAPGFGDLLIRAEAGRIYVSQSGGAFGELRLGDTAEARLLQELLAQHGGAGVRLPPTILAGAGGEGFHWPAGGRRTTLANPPPAGAGSPAATPATATSPQPPAAPRTTKIDRAGGKE
jgi:hypothetical protein